MQRYPLKGGKSVSQVFLLEAIALSVLGATPFLIHFLTDAPVRASLLGQLMNEAPTAL